MPSDPFWVDSKMLDQWSCESCRHDDIYGGKVHEESGWTQERPFLAQSAV